jgi:hypothetical protein
MAAPPNRPTHPNAPHPNAPSSPSSPISNSGPGSGGGQRSGPRQVSRGKPATGAWRQYVTSDTLQAVDLNGRHHVVVIEEVVQAQMADRKEPKKAKGVLNVYFRGFRKPLVVKAEISGVLTKLAGSRVCAKWVGMAVEIYPITIRAFGEDHDVVRISNRRPTPDEARIAGGRAPEPEPPDTDFEEDEIREVPAEGPVSSQGPQQDPAEGTPRGQTGPLRDPLHDGGPSAGPPGPDEQLELLNAERKERR